MDQKVKRGRTAGKPAPLRAGLLEKAEFVSGRFIERKAKEAPLTRALKAETGQKVTSDRFARMLGQAGPGPSTDDIMALTRGDD